MVAGLIGILIEQGIIRFLYGRPLETLLATWGLSLILQQAVRTAFGPTNREVGAPSWMSGAFERRPDQHHLRPALDHLSSRMMVFVGLLGLLRFTRLGLEMRAVTQNRAMAASMGIRTARVDALTFGLGSGIAGIAGVALSQIDNVSPNLGPGLHHRQLHGRGVRRRRQSLGHAGRRLQRSASPTSSWSPMPARCSPRSRSW